MVNADSRQNVTNVASPPLSPEQTAQILFLQRLLVTYSEPIDHNVQCPLIEVSGLSAYAPRVRTEAAAWALRQPS